VQDPKYLNEQDQKDVETQTHQRDREAESAFLTDNSGNDLNTPDPKQTQKDLDEVKPTIENHKDDPDNDATEKIMTWMKQRRQDWQDW
jgi:hypothetical protein